MGSSILNDADYAAAFAFLNGKEFVGKLLRVAEATPRKPRPAPVKNDATRDVETRRSSPTVAVAPPYRDYPPTGADLNDKGAL